MSRRNRGTNGNDVAVARYQMIGTVVKAVAPVVAALIGGATVTIGLSMYQANNTVVYAPGGTVAVTSGEVSADAGALSARENR